MSLFKHLISWWFLTAHFLRTRQMFSLSGETGNFYSPFVLKLTKDLGKRCYTKAECVQQLVCPSVGTGLMNQCNLNQLKPLFPHACSMLSLGASPRAEKCFLYWLALVRLSHLGRVWMAFACRLFSCMKNAWIFPQVLNNAIFRCWELQAKIIVFSDGNQMCSLHLIIWTHSLGMSGRQTFPSFLLCSCEDTVSL